MGEISPPKITQLIVISKYQADNILGMSDTRYDCIFRVH